MNQKRLVGSQSRFPQRKGGTHESTESTESSIGTLEAEPEIPPRSRRQVNDNNTDTARRAQSGDSRAQSRKGAQMAKHRLQFDFDDNAFKELNELQEIAGFPNRADLVRQAL